MTATVVIPIFCSVVSMCCALFVAVRAGSWRKSDEAQALFTTIADIKERLKVCETRQEDLPSKADVARLFGRLDTLTEMVNAANAGVNRIEDHFIRNYVGPK